MNILMFFFHFPPMSGCGSIVSHGIVNALSEFDNKITVLGIAKRLEEIYSLQDPIPLYLDKRSESLKLIQHMRNEAHRFAITFHRNKRSNKALRSSIDLIPGIGEKTKITLLKKYKSLKKIKETPEELIAKDVGVSKAKKLMSFLNSSS